MQGQVDYSVGDFGDERLRKVGAQLHQSMVEQQSVCLRKLAGQRAGQVRFGRFINNDRVTVDALIDGVCQGIDERCAGRYVLAIEDTSELNYQAHAGRVSDLGPVGNGVDLGLFVHPVLVVDAQESACLGLAHVHLWQRQPHKVAHRSKQALEDKESARWITAAQSACQRLRSARGVTVVADRESDIYDMWARLPDEHTGLLVRARHDRSIELQGARASLFDCLSAQPEADRYEVDLPALNERRSAHTAVMQVRFAPVSIRRPHSCTDKGAPASVNLWAIEVREDSASVVGNEKPIHWRLLTSHRIETAQMARQCIGWYCQRWHIEQLFRTLKRQGLDVESSLLETGLRLQKLAVLALSAATRTLQLTLARDGSQRPASDAFTSQEIEVLKQVGPTLEGKTAKQKNPYPPKALSWAAWIIGRLGGWNGYASERKSGPITMHRGLKEFTAIWRGWCLRQGLRDVCTQ